MSFWAGVLGIGLIAGFLFNNTGWLYGSIGAALLWFSIARFWSRYKAASNALLAKYTFEHLPESGKEAVLEEVAKIMTKARFPIKEPEAALAGMQPAARFGFYALAMAGLGIAPKVGTGWYDVQNPYTQTMGAHREFATARHQLHRKYGVDIDLTSA